MIETVLMFFVLFGPDFTYKATEWNFFRKFFQWKSILAHFDYWQTIYLKIDHDSLIDEIWA